MFVRSFTRLSIRRFATAAPKVEPSASKVGSEAVEGKAASAAQKRAAPKVKKAVRIPKPSKEVPDVNTFLEKIGRGATENAETFENDWKKFFTMDSRKMKEEGIDTKLRRYILDWREKYAQGIPLGEIKLPVKKHGGERRRRIYAAEKKVKERISMAQLRKAYRKKTNLENIQKRKWEKLHLKAQES